MSHYGTGYGTARTDPGATSIDRDYRGAAGYGATSSAPVVSFRNVSKHYGSLKAVDGLTLDLRAGQTVALLGPNGAGKSTSLDMLLALRKPTGGTIEMFGDDPYHAVKSGRVGAMLQSGGLMPEVTVRELVTLVTTLHPKPEPVDTTLKRAGISQFADQRVDRLSGGQTQRVRFALAICGQSELIVLDEPTAAMDVETRRLFWDSMKEEVAGGARCCSPRTTWRRPTRPPTGSWSSTGAGCWPTGRPPRSRRGPGPSASPSGWTGWTSRSCSACPGW